ncbi:hypothetical protein [Massilia niabensis]|uniref:Autotransporter domain-containing protein n=1 Tax=Massilia niabensis TaxID=544910 RepID=A0ABW0L2T8_9BURK
MASFLRATIGILLPLLTIDCASAQWLGEAGVGARRVSHREYDNSGRLLVRETGWLPGVVLKASRTAGSITGFGALDGYRRDIGYVGRTQAGVGADSTTATTLASLRLGASYDLGRGTALTAALETDRWKRTIRGTRTAAGLQERYRSERLIVGAGRTWHPALGVLGADAALVLSTPERMRVGFSGLLDPASLETQRGRGARIGARFVPVAAPALAFHGTLDSIRVARSEDVPVTRNGQFTGTIAQPKHTRTALTLTVSALF